MRKKIILENAPYFVLLALKVWDGYDIIMRAILMLSGRPMELDIPELSLSSFKFKKQYYYCNHVYVLELLDVLLDDVSDNSLTSLDLMRIIKDYGKILGQHAMQSIEDFYGSNQLNVFTMLNKVLTSESWRLDFEI